MEQGGSSVKDFKSELIRLSQGNPGAVNALLELVEEVAGRNLGDLGQGILSWMIVDTFEKLKIRGPGIWVCYKYLYNGDRAKLFEALASPEMHETLVAEVKKYDCYDTASPEGWKDASK